MKEEQERSAEAIRELTIGDEVIYLKDGSHRIVLDIPVGDGVNLGVISSNSTGEEVLLPPGTVLLDEIGEVVGRWDVDRVAEAWFRWLSKTGIPEEFQETIRTHLHAEFLKQHPTETP